MKKSLLVIFLLVCMALAGCSSTGTASEVSEDNTIALPAADETDPGSDPFSRNTLGIVDEDVTRGNFHNQNRETVPQTADNLNWEDFDFYYDIMYDDIPEEAYYPAVKYAEGIWKY
ncbi:MAG: hypothetical protein J5365_03735, partial [Erysipelotrichaceae bacterium]|nr:hypothetical protein [Erysipelotrichaceae bacterium]